eukprot:gene2904-4747_t
MNENKIAEVEEFHEVFEQGTSSTKIPEILHVDSTTMKNEDIEQSYSKSGVGKEEGSESTESQQNIKIIDLPEMEHHFERNERDSITTEVPNANTKTNIEDERIITTDDESDDDVKKKLLDKRKLSLKPRDESICKTIFLKIVGFISSSILFIFPIFGFSYLFSYLFLLPYCGLLFRCGCTFLWLGGINNCNIYDPHAEHKCPWCVAPKSTAWLVNWGTPIVSTLGSYFFCLILTMVVFLRKRGTLYLIRISLNYNKYTKIFGWTFFYICNGIIFSIISFFFYGLILGLTFKFATGYPYFLFIKEHP